MDSRSTISIFRAQLNDIDAYAVRVVGDVEKITEFFIENLDQLKLSSVYVLFVDPGRICVSFCLFLTMCISITIKY